MTAPDESRQPAERSRAAIVWISAGIIVLAGAIAFLGYSVMEGLRSRSDAPPEATAAAVAPAPATPAPRAQATPPRTEPPAPRRLKLPPAADELERRRLDARATYDFGAFADWVAGQQDLTSVQGAQAMLRHYRALAEMMSWLGDRVSAATEDHPIPMFAGPAEGGRQVGGAWGEEGQVVFRGRDGVRRSVWRNIPPRRLLALYEAANRADRPRGAVLLQRRAWARAFAEEYGLTPAGQ